MSVEPALDPLTVNAQNSQGFVNQPTGPVIQHFGDNVTMIFAGDASVDDFMEGAHKSGLLARVTTRLTEAQFRTLLTLVKPTRLLGETVYRACRASLLPTAHLADTNYAFILVADMCERPPVKAWPPLLECVTRLSAVEHVDPALAAELNRWVDVAAPALSVSPDTLAEMRRQLRVERARSMTNSTFSWLQMFLEPDWTNRTQNRKQPLFGVELVLWSSRTIGPQVLSTGVGASGTNGAGLWTLDDLPLLLDAVFADRANVGLVDDINCLAIEVVAPGDTLVYGFERWKRKRGPGTYGLLHPFVVRLRDRLEIPDAADQARADSYWRDKWAAFLKCAGEDGRAPIIWRDLIGVEPFDLQDDPDAFCLGLISPLTPGTREVFDLLRDAGIPVALWLRSLDATVTLPKDWWEQISGWIADQPAADLHQAVWKIRRRSEVRGDASHFGNFLTLLWDDPKRPPLKYEQEGVFQ